MAHSLNYTMDLYDEISTGNVSIAISVGLS